MLELENLERLFLIELLKTINIQPSQPNAEALMKIAVGLLKKLDAMPVKAESDQP